MPDREKVDIEPSKRSIEFLRPFRFGDVKSSAELLGRGTQGEEAQKTESRQNEIVASHPPVSERSAG